MNGQPGERRPGSTEWWVWRRGRGQQGEWLGGPETKGQKMPTGFSGVDIMEALVGVVEGGTWKWVQENRVRLAMKGGKRMQGESAG